MLSGDRRALSRLMSLVERDEPGSAEVMEAVHPHAGRAVSVGVTGPPGVGKSTLVDALVGLLRQQGRTVGVVAVDPSSPFSGGSLLGDRIRMQQHFVDSGVFIRSVSTRGSLGGLPRITQRLVRLLDAAGHDTVLVETVGVGQAESSVMNATDTVVLVLVPEAGDVIQTMKAGVMEIADIFVVNKADREGATRLVAALRSMLGLAPRDEVWQPPVLTTQAHKGQGVDALWQAIQEHRAALERSSRLEERRRQRRRREFLETVQGSLERHLARMVAEDKGLGELLRDVEGGTLDPYAAASRFLTSADLLERWLADLRRPPDSSSVDR